MFVGLLSLLIHKTAPQRDVYRSSVTSMNISLERIRKQELPSEPLAVWKTTLKKEDLTDNDFGRVFRSPRGRLGAASFDAGDPNITQLYGFEIRQSSRRAPGPLDKPKPLYVNRVDAQERNPQPFGVDEEQAAEPNVQPLFYIPTATHAALRESNGRRGGGMNR